MWEKRERRKEESDREEERQERKGNKENKEQEKDNNIWKWKQREIVEVERGRGSVRNGVMKKEE